MTPLSFWQLLGLLIALLVVGRIVAGWLWHALLRLAGALGPRLRRALYFPSFARAAENRAPRLSGFVVNRLNPRYFTGLALSLMTVLAAYLVVLSTDLVEDLFEGPGLKHFDHEVNTALSVVRNERFLVLMDKITSLANLETLIAIVLVSIGFLWAYGRARFIPGLLLTVAGSQTLTYIGKYAIDRERPNFLTFASATTPSFPSGHAAGAIAVYGFIGYAIARDLPRARARFEFAYWGCALIALIAASRAILSVHYASDIGAGLLVGGFWLLAGFALTEILRERAQPSPRVTPGAPS